MCAETHAWRAAPSDPPLCSQTRVYVPFERLSAAVNPSKRLDQVLWAHFPSVS